MALFLLCSIPGAFASAYNARPKLIVVIVIDQFRGDYLERYHDQFGDGGFRVFIDRGAYFTDCNYDYANTRTAPGHATLFTGANTSGHGIIANEWWDPQKKKRVTSVESDTTKLVGVAKTGVGASPHNLMSDTLGDELKMATGGKARVFAISLKDRAAVLPAGFSGDAAYWIYLLRVEIGSPPHTTVPIFPSGCAISTAAIARKNSGIESGEIKTAAEISWARPHREPPKTARPPASTRLSAPLPSPTITNWNSPRNSFCTKSWGAGPATDLLVISLSANDILGHQVGPDSPQMRSMALELDRSLAEFFDFLGHQIGMANVWMALSADHGVAPLPEFAKTLRLPAANLDAKALRGQVNSLLSKNTPRKPTTSSISITRSPG